MQINKMLILMVILLFVGTTSGQIDPPNYDFSLDKFKALLPGQILPKDLDKGPLGKPIIMAKKGPLLRYRFMIEHLRYRFPVFVQVAQNSQMIVDFYATLPTYFLHDVFHQSLINRLGKQDRYLTHEQVAIYKWNDKENIRHIYSATCTITCFPLYYSANLVKPPQGVPSITPLLEEMNTASAFN